MVIKAEELDSSGGRTAYPVEGHQELVGHFVRRVTTSENPFEPHKHDGEEFWFILGGEGIVSVGGQDTTVGAGDLIVLTAWKEHGLRSETEVQWLCFG